MPKPDASRLMREVRCLVGEADREGTPDGHLLARFVDQRDELAFELLVRRYGRLVFGVCRRVLADAHTAEDAFQATFLVLVHKAASLDRKRSVADWLYTVAFRLACRARANAARRRTTETAAAQGRTTIANPAVPDDGLAVVHEELNRLPDQHRVPLVLSYLEGRNYEQVAEAIGCPVGSVGRRLTRARELLRERLTHRGVVCPAAGIAALVASAGAGAAVPASLFDTTVRAAEWFAGEQASEVAPSALALELARGAIGSVTLSKWALAAGVLLVIGFGGGTAWLARSAAKGDAPAPIVETLADAPKDTKPALPAGVTSRLGTAQFRHGDAVFFIAYTADGKHIVTAGRDKTIRLWDRANGNELRQFERAAGKKELLDPKPDAAAAMSGKKMKQATAEDFPVALSDDGKTLAAARDRTITVWDVATGKTLHELTATTTVLELTFSLDGKSLIGLATDETVLVWDSGTGAVARTIKPKLPTQGEEVIASMTLSPGGGHLIGQSIERNTANATLHLHDLTTDKPAGDVKLGVGGVQTVAFTPDGKFLAWASLLDGVAVWDLGAGREVATFGRTDLNKPRSFPQNLQLAPDGKSLALVQADDTIELWDVATGKMVSKLGVPEGDEAAPAQVARAVRIVLNGLSRPRRQDLAFSPDGKTLAVSMGHATIRQFDTGTGKEVVATPGHLSGVMTSGTDGRTVVTVSRESVRVWDTAGGELRHWSLAPPAVSAAVSPDVKRVATSPGGGVVRVWDAATGTKLREFKTQRPDVAGIAFSPDGKLLATKAELNSAVNLWNAETGDHIRTVGQDGEPAFNAGKVTIDASGVQTPAIAFSLDGRLLAAAGDRKQLSVWDVATGTVVGEITVPGREAAVAFGFSANGHVLALVTSTGAVTGYEVATGEKRFETRPTNEANAVALYPGEMMGGVTTGNILGRGNANAGAIGFSPDGRFVLSAAGSSLIRVWDTLLGQEAGQLKGHGGTVSHLRVAPDGRSFVSGSVDTTALVWDLTKLARVELARETALTQTELDGLWADLAKSDAATAFTATRKLLTDRKQAATLLGERVRPVSSVDDARIAELVANLGGSFDARRKATAELERLGELAVPHLRKALEGNPALDLKQRAEGLLQKATVRKLAGDQLRELRAVEVLELTATPEAKRVLESLAKGAAGARLTREATAALERLNVAKP